MIKKILIANRGEIAIRIMNTCHEMGISTVSVYSDADKQAAHRYKADESFYIGKSSPNESYLNIEKIINAAKTTNACAIHPGYGFLAENADFAHACINAGLIFIGPPPEVIKKFGDKTIARQMMIKTGVPVIPGMENSETDFEKLAIAAKKYSYPVLIKASAGGGGKGMRIVHSENELQAACETASREAASAFGNGSIYIEKFIKQPRHVEIQILADSKGNIIHLLERECSIQRRHQKIIEETPSTALNQLLREKMGQSAILAAKTVGYVNAGTVEFLLDQENNFYFLEVNTRLQVEHPITELITGIDIVRWQILIADNQPLTISQKDVSGRGHAIECRIYGEDPENNFFPSPGKISYMKEPTGPGIRNDCGVYSGFNVPVEYDPIISKLAVHAETRQLAIQKMIHALSNYVISGIKTPIHFMIELLQTKAFKEGETYTDFIEQHFSNWKPTFNHTELSLMAYIADELLKNNYQINDNILEHKDFSNTWETLKNWRI